MKFNLSLVCMLAATLLQAYAQKMTFTPQWTPQSQFAGYYAALANGYYADAGLVRSSHDLIQFGQHAQGWNSRHNHV